ncbi:hypothetical protein JYU34_019411 [Plutella xylostella]|uniref:C2H2-type domain-containing protein n=2 Tax=Plutella xylostella TaxID=51655 RepID=A0ABQ7PY45_PLUXY|nr:hypothetical protein JYU34_019411 [Plutella xylostella]
MVQKSDKIINESIKETETLPIYNNVSDNYRFSESDEEYIKPEPCNKEDKESKCFENAESKNCIVESDEEYKEQTSKGKVRCKICNKEVTKYYIKNHLTLHGVGTKKEKVKVECKLCKKTLEKAYYKKHLEGVHGKPDHSNYVCYVCGKTFKYQSGYKSHVLSHGNEFPYKCQLCPYRGKHSALLKVHMRTHTRDYRFQCTDCPARFLTSGNLHKHMLKHKEKKFKCDSCAKAFHTKVEVERHFQSDHLGIKNHVCNICEKAFGYRSAMMKHQLHVHKRQKMLNGRMPSYLLEERKEQEDPSQPLSECFE